MNRKVALSPETSGEAFVGARPPDIYRDYWEATAESLTTKLNLFLIL
jgi:hypothetical protein